MAECLTLPFKTRANLPADATVEWKRTEPKPMVVHVYENGQDQPYKQDEYYYGHTKMIADPLQYKDLSVTINNFGYSDRGTYVCTVHKDGDILAQKVVERRLIFSVAKVEVEYWAKTVQLPWQITANLPPDATVTWTRHNVSMFQINVHVFENGRDQPETQDLAYIGRTNMRKNPLRTGDLGLTLINPTHTDSSLYTGTVCKNGDVLWERQVHLNVNARRHY